MLMMDPYVLEADFSFQVQIPICSVLPPIDSGHIWARQNPEAKVLPLFDTNHFQLWHVLAYCWYWDKALNHRLCVSEKVLTLEGCF